MLSSIHIELFLALSVIAACTDFASRRIPNWVPAAIAIAGIAVQLERAGWRAAMGCGVAAFVGLLLLSVPWRLRLIGGADAKLAAAMTAWVYPDRLAHFVLASALAGLVIAVPYYGIAFRRALRAGAMASSASELAAGIVGGAAARRDVPFGVALACGGMLCVLWR